MLVPQPHKPEHQHATAVRYTAVSVLDRCSPDCPQDLRTDSHDNSPRFSKTLRLACVLLALPDRFTIILFLRWGATRPDQFLSSFRLVLADSSLLYLALLALWLAPIRTPLCPVKYSRNYLEHLLRSVCMVSASVPYVWEDFWCICFCFSPILSVRLPMTLFVVTI